MSYANNKGADQPAHPRSLLSAFVIRCLDSINRFSHDVAEMVDPSGIMGCFGNMSHVTRKPVFGSLRPGKTQTGLLSFRNQLES